MRRKLKPLLSALLTIAMLLSLLPTAAFAKGETGTFTKITTQEKLTDGKYVIVVDSGYAVGALDDDWLTATPVTEEGGSLADPAANLVWDVTVTDNGVTLTDANGVQVAPKGGNTNGIKADSYTWATSFENGTFRFLGVDADTVTLASNKGSGNKFRAYKNATINAGYPCDFTLYQYVEGTGTIDPDPGEEPDPEPETITIAEALAAKDNTEGLIVKGVVTLIDDKNIYLQDSTGGICARMGSAPQDIALGDTVIATGKRAAYNGLPQLGSATYEKSSGLTLTPAVKTIGELTDADICTYVTLRNVEVTEVYDNNGDYSNPNITVKDSNGNTIQLYKAVVDKNSEGAWSVKVGDTITITAAVGVFKETLQLRNTNASEIDLDGTPAGPIAHGDQVVIYNPGSGKALSAEAAGTYYRAGKEFNPETDVNNLTGDLVWDVSVDAEGNYLFSNNGNKLSVNASNNSLPLNEVNDTWKVEAATTEGCYYLINVNRPTLYVEWYAQHSEFSTYNYSASSEGIYAMQLIKVDYEGQEPGGEVEFPESFVIYNDGAQGVLAGQDDNTTSPSVNNAAATVADGVATPTNGARVFTVEKTEDGYYRFKAADGYLASNGMPSISLRMRSIRRPTGR